MDRFTAQAATGTLPSEAWWLMGTATSWLRTSHDLWHGEFDDLGRWRISHPEAIGNKRMHGLPNSDEHGNRRGRATQIATPQAEMTRQEPAPALQTVPQWEAHRPTPAHPSPGAPPIEQSCPASQLHQPDPSRHLRKIRPQHAQSNYRRCSETPRATW